MISPWSGADPLPGRYVLSRLVDAHAHPAVAAGAPGPVALDPGAAHANLIAWAKAGITLVRDAGSPGESRHASPPIYRRACSREHHHVERPPTVPWVIGAPSRGQVPPACRAAKISPVCAPPLAVADSRTDFVAR
jgi:hypothetical protein